MSMNYRHLRERLQIEEVLRWISWEASSHSGDQLRGRCLFCESSDTASPGARSFSVNTRRNIYHCFRCQAGGNTIDLWRNYHRLPLYTAAKELQSRLDQNTQPQKRD